MSQMRAEKRTRQKYAGELATAEEALKAGEARLRGALEEVEFHGPQYELRFTDLDMSEIQRLTQHPLVQAIGKTDMSLAGIRVVVG